jgi:hypothetical protein
MEDLNNMDDPAVFGNHMPYKRPPVSAAPGAGGGPRFLRGKSGNLDEPTWIRNEAD